MEAIGTDVNQVQITSLSRIKGQSHVIQTLEVHLRAHFNIRQSTTGCTPCFGPVLLSGPSGTGKTLTAGALHAELGNLTLIETNGVALNKKDEIYSVLLNADANTTVFIDEAQGMNPKTQQILLTAISEKKVYVPSGLSLNHFYH